MSTPYERDSERLEPQVRRDGPTEDLRDLMSMHCSHHRVGVGYGWSDFHAWCRFCIEAAVRHLLRRRGFVMRCPWCGETITQEIAFDRPLHDDPRHQQDLWARYDADRRRFADEAQRHVLSHIKRAA